MSFHYHLSRCIIIFIWFWHGLVPKLIAHHEQEILMNERFLPFLSEQQALLISGVAEIIYALLLLIFYRSTKLLIPTFLFAILSLPPIIIALPHLLLAAFNPLTLNLALLSLALINYKSGQELKT